jgi:hypothetical protein
LLRYAQEASWREDNRREPNGSQVERLAGSVLIDDAGTRDNKVNGAITQR